jgi:hypothetical protein
MEEIMTLLKSMAALAAVAVSLTVGAFAAGPGGCGEYMYWKQGKCVDAKNAASEPWPDQMAKKKATW